jgi:hypothetical protein
MSHANITLIRWVLLALAALAFLHATILFDFFEKHFFERWVALSERRGAQIPSFMRGRSVHRAWAATSAILFAALWWFLGTPAGIAFLRQE